MPLPRPHMELHWGKASKVDGWAAEARVPSDGAVTEACRTRLLFKHASHARCKAEHVLKICTTKVPKVSHRPNTTILHPLQVLEQETAACPSEAHHMRYVATPFPPFSRPRCQSIQPLTCPSPATSNAAVALSSCCTSACLCCRAHSDPGDSGADVQPLAPPLLLSSDARAPRSVLPPAPVPLSREALQRIRMHGTAHDGMVHADGMLG